MILEKQASMIAAALRRMSLKTRLTVATVGLFVLFIWVLVFLSVTVLQDRLEKVLSAQQLASTRHSAIEIDNSLLDRLEGLRRVAALLPADLRDEVQQPALSNRPLLGIYFPGGSLLLGLDGKVIAEHPPGGVRRERDFKDEDYFRQVVATRQPYIGKPGVDSVSRRPTLTLAVPALDEEGRVRAVLTGAVDLTAPNFSSLASEQAQEGKGAFFVLSLRDRRVVVAGDSGRVATALPARGRDAMLDRMADGFEGSGIGVGADGVSRLYSGKRVQMADWLVLSVLPTEVAFAPVRVMRNALYVVGALLTFLALGLLHGLTRRMLAPLDEAGDAMRRMTDGRTPLAPLPLRRNDEIGQLIGNFNHLVEDRSRYETALRESEQRFRLLVEAAPDAIIVQTAGHIVYANTAAISLLGARGEEQLLGMPVLAHVHPDCHEMVSRRIRALDSGSIYVPPLEQTYLRLDGTPVAVEVSAVRFRYEAQDGALVYVRDITERKALERERESRRCGWSACRGACWRCRRRSGAGCRPNCTTVPVRTSPPSASCCGRRSSRGRWPVRRSVRPCSKMRAPCSTTPRRASARSAPNCVRRCSTTADCCRPWKATPRASPRAPESRSASTARHPSGGCRRRSNRACSALRRRP